MNQEDEPSNKQKSQTVVVDKDASPDLGSKKKTIDQHQINELTDSIVDDLIKNAFRPEPVQIEEDQKDASGDDLQETLEKEYLENSPEEEDNLNIRDQNKKQELSKEDAKQIKSPVKKRPGDDKDKFSSDGEEQSQEEEEEYIELGYQEISKVLYIDTKVMNFGTFMPGGKLLGSNLMI